MTRKTQGSEGKEKECNGERKEGIKENEGHQGLGPSSKDPWVDPIHNRDGTPLTRRTPIDALCCAREKKRRG